MGHSRSSLKCPTSPPLYPCLSFKPKYWANLSLFQWRIHGRGPGGPPPLFLDQTKAVRSEKNFLENAPPPPPISRSGSGTVFFCLVCRFIFYIQVVIVLIQVYNCDIRHHSIVYRCGLAAI